MHDGNKFDILAARSRHAYPLTNGTRRAGNRHNGTSGRANRAHASTPDAGELGRSQDAGSELAGKHTRVGRTPVTRTRRHHAIEKSTPRVAHRRGILHEASRNPGRSSKISSISAHNPKAVAWSLRDARMRPAARGRLESAGACGGRCCGRAGGRARTGENLPVSSKQAVQRWPGSCRRSCRRRRSKTPANLGGGEQIALLQQPPSSAEMPNLVRI